MVTARTRWPRRPASTCCATAARRRCGGRRQRRALGALSAHDRHRRRCLLADLRRRARTPCATSTAAAAPRRAARSRPSPARPRPRCPFAASLPGTLTVPGAVASWTKAHAAYGRLPLQALPGKRHRLCARRLSGDGAARALARRVRAGAGARVPKPRRSSSTGRRRSLTNPDLARTLEAIASDGWYGFYDGEVARELVRYSRRQRRLLHARTISRRRSRAGASRSRAAIATSRSTRRRRRRRASPCSRC